jgi:hypothetical protein
MSGASGFIGTIECVTIECLLTHDGRGTAPAIVVWLAFFAGHGPRSYFQSILVARSAPWRIALNFSQTTVL